MGAGARALLYVAMGRAVQAVAGLQRPRRAAAERRLVAGPLRQRHLHLLRLRILASASRRRSRSHPPVREPGQRRTSMTEIPQSPVPGLAREVGLREATALNIIDMIGVGPF